MTRALQEPSGLPDSAANGRRPEPPGFLSAYPGYRSTALLDRLRAAEYSYLDAGGHVYLDYTGAGLPAQAQLAAQAERMRGGCFGNPHSENPTSAASTELIERARRAIQLRFPRLHLPGPSCPWPQRLLYRLLPGYQRQGEEGERPADQGLAP